MTISDIVQSIYRRTKTNSATYPAPSMLIAINTAYNYVVSCINDADHTWQWEDYNQTDLPIATTALVAGQQDYTLTTSYLSIDRVEVQDTAGTWHLLKQIDQQALKAGTATALAAYQSSAGVPTEYDISGSSVFLYPIPNYNQAASLKVYFTRGPAEFTSQEVTDGTKVPGFPSLFHDMIPLHVAYDYAVVNLPRLAQGYLMQLQQMKREINDFYGLRNRDNRARITTSGDNK
jgi:hypothetical protein